MKKYLLALIFVLALSATASAHEYHHDWSDSSYNNDNWHHSRHHEQGPFNWHESHERFSSGYYRMERIHDWEWNSRFPGLHSYRWHAHHGQGFWYHGDYVKNAVLFYNHSDELVSVGFMHNGTFIFLRDDHNHYENNDSFFISWWNR